MYNTTGYLKKTPTLSTDIGAGLGGVGERGGDVQSQAFPQASLFIYSEEVLPETPPPKSTGSPMCSNDAAAAAAASVGLWPYSHTPTHIYPHVS